MDIGNSEDTNGKDGGSGGGDGRESGGRGKGRGEGDSLETLNFSKLSKLSVAVTAQTAAAAIIFFYFSGQSSSSKVLLVSTMVSSLVCYLSSLISILLLNYNRRVAGILGGIGIVAFVLGSIQVIALSLPANLAWIVVLPCLAFFLVFVMVICRTELARKSHSNSSNKPQPTHAMRCSSK